VLEPIYDFPGGKLLIYPALDLAGQTRLMGQPSEERECLPLAHGLALPIGDDTNPILHTREGEPVAVLEIGVVGGRAACVGIRALPGSELTTLLLRQLEALQKLVSTVAAKRAVRVMRKDDNLIGVRYINAEEFTGMDEGRRVVEETVSGKPRALSDDFLREVAHVYRTALASRQSTERAICERWPTSPANARRWVALARKRGLLGKAPRERGAGETTDNQPEGGSHG